MRALMPKHQTKGDSEMIYVGMDLSSKSFMVHAIDQRKKVVLQGEISPSRVGLRALVERLPVGPKVMVFEAGNQMKWVSLELKKVKDVKPYPVHPNEVKWIISSRGKTDKIDARKLAELARADMLPRPIHIVEGEVRKLRELGSARIRLQSKRVALVNTIRGYVKQEGLRLPVKFFQHRDWREKLSKLKVSDTLKLIITSYMEAIDGILASEAKITEQIKNVQDPRCELLETIPAIGKLTSRVLLGAIDNASRFDDKKAIANYGALTPTIYQSGEITHLGHINRDGREEIRRVLLQCAHTITRTKTADVKPLKDFYERVAKKRGKKIAVVAVARKLLTTAYGVLKTGKPYNPDRLLGMVA